MPRNDLTLRPAVRRDVAEVLALYRQPAMDRETLAPADAEALFDRIQRYPDYQVLVAVEPAPTAADGDAAPARIVGTYLLLIMDKLSHLGTPTAVVDDVVVAPDRQGGGIGSAMMRDAMARARARGCGKLTLSSNLSRERAHRFYEKLGFTQHGLSFQVTL